MAKTSVTFTMKKTGSLVPLVVLRLFPGTEKVVLEFPDVTETRDLEAGATYAVSWDVVGDLGDTFTVTWKADDGQSGTLIDNFTIDAAHVDARPWPGGKWFDHGINGLKL